MIKPSTDEVLMEALNALEKCGGERTAAKSLNIPYTTLRNRIQAAKKRGLSTTTQKLSVLHGVSDDPAHGLTHPIPDPLIIRGTSNLYDKDGVLLLQWVKSKLDDQKLSEAIRAAIFAMSESMPRAEPVPQPTHLTSALINLYTFTDCHVGMKAWSPETGADWDLEIAEKTLCRSFDYLISASPPSVSCIINQLGDFLHFDSLSAVTPQNHNLLDVDSRFSKVIKVAVRVLRYIVSKALMKYQVVYFFVSEGNHDPASAPWLRTLFSILYENEPRVVVCQNETPYSCHVHGKTFLGFHHGHLIKKNNLPLQFASTYPHEWGLTTHRYAHTGHLHSEEEKEHAGMKVHQHATIAARDSYAARYFPPTDRQIEVITYHEEFGRVGSINVVPEMIELK